MAPRQRIAPQPSQEELGLATSVLDAKPLLQSSSAGIEENAAEAARERHDLFNVVALVRKYSVRLCSLVFLRVSRAGFQCRQTSFLHVV